MTERTVEVIRKELQRAEDSMYQGEVDRDLARRELQRRQNVYESAARSVNDLRAELEVEEARAAELETLKKRVADLERQLEESNG